MADFKIGDYVIADHALYDTFTNTFVVTKLGKNAFDVPLIAVRDVNDGMRTVFYPSELSFEGGTRP